MTFSQASPTATPPRLAGPFRAQRAPLIRRVFQQVVQLPQVLVGQPLEETVESLPRFLRQESLLQQYLPNLGQLLHITHRRLLFGHPAP
jgi:hypothetical protein